MNNIEPLLNVKTIGVTMLGKKILLNVPKDMDKDSLFEAFSKLKIMIANYYFTQLIIDDMVMLLFEQNLQESKLYKFNTKKNFRQLQSSIRKKIKVIRQDFVVADYYDELSSQIWDDVNKDIESVRKKIYSIIEEECGDCKIAKTYSYLIMVANMIYLAHDTYLSILETTKNDKGVDFSNVIEHISIGASYNFVSQWCRDFIRDYEKIDEKINNDEAIQKSMDRVSDNIIDYKKLDERQNNAYNEIYDGKKVKWCPMSENPKEGSEIIIYNQGTEKLYKYSKGYLYRENVRLRWDDAQHKMWKYK